MMNNPSTDDATKRSREYQNQPVNSSSAIAMWWEKNVRLKRTYEEKTAAEAHDSKRCWCDEAQ